VGTDGLHGHLVSASGVRKGLTHADGTNSGQGGELIDDPAQLDHALRAIGVIPWQDGQTLGHPSSRFEPGVYGSEVPQGPEAEPGDHNQ